ncbi:MAG: mechanosensitive ion channel, partial [Longimicrobiales bacterium]|nr:mechanosensitive ion channel [Longimicrobiales bacterium]
LTPTEVAAGADPLTLSALVTQRVMLAFIIITAVLSLDALLDAVNEIYAESYEEARSRPIKGYLQVVMLVAYIAAVIIVISILADRSPLVFLSGLGALTAVLLLVFRDTILSFVASLQIMSNDMIRIGDWVEMPQANADGDVIDIALHTVKIQNWDKTITTVPTHKFISDSFKNWRGMSESGGRRIKRSLHLDLSTVRFLTDDEVERLSRYELLRDYMRQKREELAEHRAKKKAAGEDVVPEIRRLTNAGTFRAYVFAYLKRHPLIHDEMTLLVRQLAPTPKGLPIEVYCFTNDTAWATYEGVQGDIFDHLIAILPEFGLEAFQEPAGSDFARIGAVTPDLRE